MSENEKIIMKVPPSVRFGKTEPSEVSSAGLLDAAKELKRAIEFYDRVTASSEDEQMAVGRDHFDWVFRAARKVAGEASNTQLSELAENEES